MVVACCVVNIEPKLIWYVTVVGGAARVLNVHDVTTPNEGPPPRTAFINNQLKKFNYW